MKSNLGISVKIGRLLQDVLKITDTLIKEDDPRTIFHNRNIPSISIEGYSNRLATFLQASNACYVLAFIYMDKLIRLPEGPPLNSFTAHRYIYIYIYIRMLLVCLRIATKIHDDNFYNNAGLAKIGGIDIEDLNKLEVECLMSLEFGIYISKDEYTKFLCNINEHIKKEESPSPIEDENQEWENWNPESSNEQLESSSEETSIGEEEEVTFIDHNMLEQMGQKLAPIPREEKLKLELAHCSSPIQSRNLQDIREETDMAKGCKMIWTGLKLVLRSLI